MKKAMLKMNVSEIIAASVCVGMVVAFLMVVARYITGYSIFTILGVAGLFGIPYMTLCVIMGILLIAERKLRKRGKEAC